MIVHFTNCRADYPEKPAGEAPQRIEEIVIDDDEVILQCVDCGAYEIRPKVQDAK